MKPTDINRKLPNTIPREKFIDSSLLLLMEGYLFIPNRIRKYGSDLFQIRLMGQKAICISGKEAATLFYDQNLFTREGAMPKRIQETLFGKKAIQTLDGAAHMHRKLLFMSIMTPSQINRIINLTTSLWQIKSKRWEGKHKVVLFDEANKLLFQVACKWAGVPLHKSEIRQRSQDMSAMIDAFGAAGPRHWKGRYARNRSECWAGDIIRTVRAGRIIVPKDTALNAIAWHRDLSGNLLETQVAAVELLNILRPITAIATYITFGALALHTYPECKEKLQQKDDTYLSMFIQEIRRYYPFGPFLAARVRNDFNWHNYNFKKDTLVLLDIFGTNHDESTWKDANIFQPERFRDRNEDPFDFIPQGGGDYNKGTRCPGEMITLALMKESLKFLSTRIEYQVPLQDLTYRLSRMPTLPKSKFIINNIRIKN
ncbi:MAG: cytochrome [Herbinix sp.]|jgi:fatty-acid peroxygenase|nr:cytochrome [Herbinix sp.]